MGTSNGGAGDFQLDDLTKLLVVGAQVLQQVRFGAWLPLSC